MRRVQASGLASPAALTLALCLVGCNSHTPGTDTESAGPSARSITAPTAEGHRFALVIGNDNYQSVTPLHNARADARAVAEALRKVGFKVTLEQDVTLAKLKSSLRTFKSQVSGGDDAVFYFSGHGVQFEGTNYLIPTDLAPQSEEQVMDDAVPLQRVLDDLRDQKARFALAIVDACRDNPFKGSGRAIGGRGLAPVTAASGQMVMYSAGAGQEALDRLGSGDSDPNGVFTRVLIREISKPGVPADQVLKHVKAQVVELAEEVHHEQVPALYDQSLGEFYFVPPQPSAASAAPSPSAGTSGGAIASDAIHVQTGNELEQSFWNRIKDSTDAADFKDYTRQFPQGGHVAEAQLMVRRLERSVRRREPAAAALAAQGTAAGSAEPARPVATSSGTSEGGRTFSVTPGTYGAAATTSLQPGTTLRGKMVLQRNGDFLYTGTNGVTVRGSLDFSAPDRISGTATATQPRVLGVPLIRYPDGSSSTSMTIRAKIVGGKLQGQYTDPFETGTLFADLSNPL
ncbi:MAG: caspase family protein [Gammaproteobacteria bacterium]|nr:caspase family protein [Gammaproteobacteria bacterium]